LEAARGRQDAVRANRQKLQDLLKESRDWVGLDGQVLTAAAVFISECCRRPPRESGGSLRR
jgi:hypothetical protein